MAASLTIRRNLVGIHGTAVIKPLREKKRKPNSQGANQPPQAAKVPALLMISEFGITDGPKFKTLYAPKEVDYSGFEATYNEIARPDRQPIMLRNGQSLRKMSMTLILAHFDIEKTVETKLEQLEKLAKSPIPLLVNYDQRSYGMWHITSLSYKSTERAKIDDSITRAEVSIEFTETTSSTKFTINRKRVGNRPKTYKPKKKETLQQIVQKFYQTNNAQIVKAVAKVNKIKNPKHLKPGKPIKLP